MGKKRSLYILIIFCFFIVGLKSQNNQVLLKQLQLAKFDTTKCRILSELIENESDTKIWIKYNIELEKIASAKNKTLGTNIFLLSALANAKTNWGYYYDFIGKGDSAFYYYHQALNIQFDIKDRGGAATTLNNLGALYKKKGDYYNAINYFDRSLKLSKDIKDDTGTAIRLMNLSDIYLEQEDTTKSINYLFESITIRKKINDLKGLANCYNILGGRLLKNSKPSVAINYIKKGLVIRQQINDQSGLANSTFNIGKIYFEAGQLDSCLIYLNEAKLMYENVQDKKGQSNINYFLGKVYNKLNQQRVAKSYFEQSLLVANQLGFPADIAKPAKELYLINKSMGKHLLALSLLELYIKMKDSLTTSKQLYSKQNKNLVTLLSSKIIADSLKSQKYTNSICTNLIITQEKLVQNKRTIITLITIIALILIFVIFVLFKNKKI